MNGPLEGEDATVATGELVAVGGLVGVAVDVLVDVRMGVGVVLGTVVGVSVPVGTSVGVPVEILIDGIVDDFPDEVMQPLAIDAADVHRRAFAHGIEAFEDINVSGAVVGS